jgi:hypothetical protein
LVFGSYFAFLVGIAAVTILVNSITIGLLVYNFQMAKDGQNYYYGRFRDAVSAVRDHLDSLHADGLISSEYDESYREIELLTMETLPVGWKEIFVPFLEELFDELRNNLESEDSVEWHEQDSGFPAVHPVTQMIGFPGMSRLRWSSSMKPSVDCGSI